MPSSVSVMIWITNFDFVTLKFTVWRFPLYPLVRLSRVCENRSITSRTLAPISNRPVTWLLTRGIPALSSFVERAGNRSQGEASESKTQWSFRTRFRQRLPNRFFDVSYIVGRGLIGRLGDRRWSPPSKRFYYWILSLIVTAGECRTQITCTQT